MVKRDPTMTINYINTGSGPNRGDGDSLRVAFTKINNNFEQVISELSVIESGSTSTLVAGTATFAITTSGTLVLNGQPFNVDLGNYNFSGSILQADNPIFRANDAVLTLAVDTSTWTFSQDGSLEFPAGYILPNTIGAPGQVITLGGQGGTYWAPTVSIGDSAPALQDLWFNNSEGRLYIKDNGIWVDANPTVIPPPSTYLDDITVEGSTFTINGSSLTIDEAGTLLVNGTQVTGEIAPTDQITSGSYRVSVADTGVVTMATSRGNLEFGALPEPGCPGHFHIMRAPGQDDSGGMDLFFGDDFNYVRQRHAANGSEPAYGVEIGANDFIGNQQVWRFGTDGILTIPGDIQDANGSVVRVASTSTAPTRADGQLWFNNQEGRLYIKDNDTWVDTNPTVIPPPSTYLDDITVEGSTFTINGSTLTIDSTGTLLVNGGQVSGSGGGVGFEYATIQEGITNHPVTSITGNSGDGLSLTSDRWAQLMWVPDTGVVTLNDIDSGGSRYNWAYVDLLGLNIENKTSSTQSWLFDNNGSIELPQYGQADGGIARLQSHNGYPTLMAYGSGGRPGPFGLHGGPELDWMDSDNPDQDFYNNTTTRHSLYLNDAGLYVGFNENDVAGNPQVNWTFKPNGNILWSTPSTATVSTFNDFAISTDKGASTKTWTFGLDGSVTLPIGSGTYGMEPMKLTSGDQTVTLGGTGTNIFIADLGAGPGIYFRTQNNNHTGTQYSMLLEGDTGNLHVPSTIIGNSGVLDLNYDGSVILSGIPSVAAVIQTTTSGSSNTSTWTFGTDGSTTFPNDTILGTGLDPNVYIETSTTSTTSTWTFAADGSLTFPDSTVQTTAYVASSVVNRTTGSWTLSTGSNTVSITVPTNSNYTMWVNGTCDNGIVNWNATVNVSNTNVPAIGSQYAWYYAVGSALVLTTIPDQIIGTPGVISTSTGYVGNTANVFTFGITNNSTSSQVVNWGYTTL